MWYREGVAADEPTLVGTSGPPRSFVCEATFRSRIPKAGA
jgi:hypothetical protein